MKNKMFCALCLMGALTSSEAFAEAKGENKAATGYNRSGDYSEYSPHFGVKGGVAMLDSSYNNAFGLGIDIGFQPYAPIGVGLEWMDFQSSDRDSSELSIDRSKLLLKASYNFGGEMMFVKYSYVGAGAGAVFDRIRGASDSTQLGIQPFAGFDFPVASADSSYRFTLGAVASYLIVSSNNPESFDLDGVVKYWF